MAGECALGWAEVIDTWPSSEAKGEDSSEATEDSIDASAIVREDFVESRPLRSRTKPVMLGGSSFSTGASLASY